jgi:hypothetical protein
VLKKLPRIKTNWNLLLVAALLGPHTTLHTRDVFATEFGSKAIIAQSKPFTRVARFSSLLVGRVRNHRGEGSDGRAKLRLNDGIGIRVLAKTIQRVFGNGGKGEARVWQGSSQEEKAGEGEQGESVHGSMLKPWMFESTRGVKMAHPTWLFILPTPRLNLNNIGDLRDDNDTSRAKAELNSGAGG